MNQDRGVGGMSNPRCSWLAWSLVALSVALVVGGIMLARTTTEAPAPELPYGSVGDADSVALFLGHGAHLLWGGSHRCFPPPPKHHRLDLLHSRIGNRARRPHEELR